MKHRHSTELTTDRLPALAAVSSGCSSGAGPMPPWQVRPATPMLWHPVYQLAYARAVQTVAEQRARFWRSLAPAPN